MSAQSVWFVDPQGNNTLGDSWTNAFTDLQVAIDSAFAGDVILIAEGTYYPADPITGSSADTFHIDKELHLEGGFLGLAAGGSGGSSGVGSPDGSPYKTRLSGDYLQTAGIPDDNVWHVVTVDGSTIPTNERVVLEHMRIEYGYADGPGLDASGGGILANDVNLFLSEVAVRDCFAQFSGGGISTRESNLTARFCRFYDDTAAFLGGGVQVSGHRTGAPDHLRSRLHNVHVRGCRSQYGGGIYTSTGSGTNLGHFEIANSVLHDNTALAQGGAIFGATDYGTNPDTTDTLRIVNCTIAYNFGGVSAGVNLDVSATVLQATIENTILWANPPSTNNGNLDGPPGGIAIAHCDFGGTALPYTSATLFSGDPKFVNPAARNLQLLPTSPCNEVGHDDLVPLDYLDIDNDLVTTLERLPLDFKVTLGGGTASARQRLDAVPAVPPAPFAGVDSDNNGQIVDLGAYEQYEPADAGGPGGGGGGGGDN